MATNHRSRFATFPEACCSSNLLEPHSICASVGFWSIVFSIVLGVFNKILLSCFESVTRVPGEFPVDKTNMPISVFAILGRHMRRLAIRPGAIGDFIVSLPALECLQTDYYEIWATSANVPLVRFADRARA